MSGPLISAADVHASLHTGAALLVDCRWYLGEPGAGHAAYRAGHLPTAVYASLDTDLSGSAGPGRHPLPDPPAFAASLRRLGVTAEASVVAYDDRGGAVAARLWWMLTQQGHPRTTVLDGGIQAWIAAGFDLTTDHVTPEPGSFDVGPWDGVADIGEIGGVGSGAVILDARSAERYRGEQEPVDAKAGHIPGAVSLPLTELLDDEQRFLSADAIRQRFSTAGVGDAHRVIAQCGSGVTACHLILAAELAGLPRPDLYVGSWSEWSATDNPIATGMEP